MHRHMRMLSIVAAGAFLPVVLLAQAPKGATAKCKDGTYSTATSKQGMCSSHGGVAQLLAAHKPAARHTAAKSTTTSTHARTTASRTRAGSATTTAPKASRASTRARPAATKSATPRPATTTKPAATEQIPTIAPPATAPAGATAECKDGTFSTSKVHTGACSHHGGVKDWLQSAH
jgi:hypothetical protein